MNRIGKTKENKIWYIEERKVKVIFTHILTHNDQPILYERLTVPKENIQIEKGEKRKYIVGGSRTKFEAIEIYNMEDEQEIKDMYTEIKNAENIEEIIIEAKNEQFQRNIDLNLE